MYFSRVGFYNDKWPFGKDGPLVVTAGTVYNLPTGSVKDYSSIYIEPSGVLNISGPAALTVIGSRGPVVIDGTIISVGEYSGSSGVASTPDRNTVTYNNDLRGSGGAGGTGGDGVYPGGAPFNGRGGGGGGGWTGGGVGGYGGNVVNNDYTLGNGYPGQPTSNGYRYSTPGYGGGGGGGQGAGRGAVGGSDQGGGGAGGGYFGANGSHIYIKTRSTITGIGLIDASGKDGFNGGVGGNGSGTKGKGGTGGSGGGGGGGGAGGCGGDIWVYSKYVTVPVISDRGEGGLGGAGGPGYGGRSGYGGANGNPGVAGDITIVTLI